GSARAVAPGSLIGHRLRPTREGLGYFIVWLALMAIGLQQQINLVLLVGGLAAGPIIGSILVSGVGLHRLRVARRAPAYVFPDDPVSLRPDGAPGDGRRSGDAAGLPDGRPAHPILAPAASRGPGDQARPAAPSDHPAVGVPRPARISPRRQPAVDPLADHGPD